MIANPITLDEQTVELSHLDKPFFPDAGVSKGDVVEYYQRIAEVMLPHLGDRPLNMLRAPDGLDGQSFFQQKVSDYFPDWIARIDIEHVQGDTVTHVLCDRAATLVYMANQGCVTPHMWLSRISALNYPDRMIFDLDPPDHDFAPVRRAAQHLRQFLTQMELTPFVQTTGSRGLHVVVPLDASADFDITRALAQDLAETLAQEHPDSLTTAHYKDQRQGRLYLDTKRNAYGQTAVAPYAVRLKPGAPVATPLDWEELNDSKLHARRYTVQNIFRRLGQKADPWTGMDQHAGSVAKVRARLKER
jgi:bifunctional non-homologous end joining protein LigD